MSMVEKKYIYKVSQKSKTLWDTMVWDNDPWDGQTIPDQVGVWKNDVISEPFFRTTINWIARDLPPPTLIVPNTRIHPF